MNFELAELKFRVSRRAWEGDHVTNIFQAGEIHHHAFEAETEAGVGHRAEWFDPSLGSIYSPGVLTVMGCGGALFVAQLSGDAVL